MLGFLSGSGRGGAGHKPDVMLAAYLDGLQIALLHTLGERAILTQAAQCLTVIRLAEHNDVSAGLKHRDDLLQMIDRLRIFDHRNEGHLLRLFHVFHPILRAEAVRVVGSAGTRRTVGGIAERPLRPLRRFLVMDVRNQDALHTHLNEAAHLPGNHVRHTHQRRHAVQLRCHNHNLNGLPVHDGMLHVDDSEVHSNRAGDVLDRGVFDVVKKTDRRATLANR